MNVLILYAHPEPNSFNGALRDVAVRTLEAEGHTVVVEDLHAQGFEARIGRHDFAQVEDATVFNVQREQRAAHDRGGAYAPDLKAEMARLDACDLLIWQCPIYWFGVPAVLKGWVDRVLAYGYAYGGARWFENGAFRGKKAMISMTTGAPKAAFSEGGRYGDISAFLWPFHMGVFRFCGFDVLPPFVAHGVGRPDPAAREAMLEEWAARLRAVPTTAPLKFNDAADFDATGALKPGIVSRAPGKPNHL